MSKKVSLVVIILTISAITISLSACTTAVSVDDAYNNMIKAYQNSADEYIYYYKETYHFGEGLSNATTKNVNVYSPLIQHKHDYNFEIDDEGRYANLAISVYSSFYDGADTKKTSSVSWTATKAKTSQDKEYKDILLRTVTGLDGKSISEYASVSAYDFIDSQVFIEDYALINLIKEIGGIKREDIVYDSSTHKANKSANVTNFYFALTEDYYERILSETGRESMLKADKIFVETAYDKISNIATYNNAVGTMLAAEDEIYDLKIVYYGPIVKNTTVDYSTLIENNNMLVK